MRPFLWTGLLLTAASALPSRLLSKGISLRRQDGDGTTSEDNTVRVRLNPASTRDLGDDDYLTWTVPNEASSDFTANETGLDFTLSAASGTISGNSYKYVYTQIINSMGQHTIAEGVSTETEDGDNAGGVALSLTISGLSAGEHSLLAWHNAWDALEATASLTISVNGEDVAQDVEQSVRVDNLWKAATSYVIFTASEGEDVEIVYTPNDGGDGRAFLNAFEVDGPAIGNQISFPDPMHRNERVDMSSDGGSVPMSWEPPQAEDATYNVYFGTSPTELESVATGLSEPSTTFTGLNTMDTYYWRVDVISGEQTYVGRVFMFRGAQLAFPGAEGYGRFARGGRGGKVVHVTTLEDSDEEGTLRHALTGVTGPRIVVFDVGGVITTQSRISVNSQYVTLAGQTAPGKGVVIQGHPLGLTGASDIIFRHVRVRPGTVSGTTIDGMGMQGSNYAIFDRCSVGWTIDESFSSRSAYNITLQRTMISEPLNIAGHKNYPEGTAHGYAASIGGDVGSFHHNLIVHAYGRSWSMAGGVDANAAFAGRLDLRNNVVYNFGGRVTDGGAHEVNFVNNLYKQGPSSELSYALKATYEDDMPGTQQYYCAGNVMPGIFDADSQQYVDDGTGKEENVACWAEVTIDSVDYRKFVDEPFFTSHVETQPATEAYKRVVSDSGVSQPVQDDHDHRIVQETLNGTTTYMGSVGGTKGIIDDPADVGGLEEFPEVTRDSSWDADGDGIADWWDGSTGGDGYTPIEGYLNFMADPHAFVTPSGSVDIDLAALAVGFLEPSFSVEGAEAGSVEVSGSTATYTAGEAAIEHLTVAIEDSEGATWTRSLGIAVFEGADNIQQDHRLQ